MRNEDFDRILSEASEESRTRVREFMERLEEGFKNDLLVESTTSEGVELQREFDQDEYFDWCWQALT